MNLKIKDHYQPQTTNYEPQTTNYEPQTTNPQPSTTNHQPSTIISYRMKECFHGEKYYFYRSDF